MPDEEELEAAAAVDPDREAHDEVEIEELLDDIDFLHQLSESDISLGKRALNKVHVIINYTSHKLISGR